MPDMTSEQANELQGKLGVTTETIKKAFSAVFSEALPYLKTVRPGRSEKAQNLYFGFKVGFLISLRDERLRVSS